MKITEEQIEKLIVEMDRSTFAFTDIQTCGYSPEYKKAFNRAIEGCIERIQQLKSSLLTQQDKIVVPEFVAEWYELNKADLSENIFLAIKRALDSNEPFYQFYDWLKTPSNKPIETLIRMKDGYTVDKVPEWVVEGDKGYLTSISITRGSSIGWSGNSDKSVAIKFTDKKKARAAAFLSDGKVVPLEGEEK